MEKKVSKVSKERKAAMELKEVKVRLLKILIVDGFY